MPKPKVLLVEDESIISMHITDMLESKGFEVLDVLSTGEEAIIKTEEHKPDIILIDIILQGKIDGIAAIEEIRSRHDIPFIYMTAHSDENTLNRAKATEPQGYIIKPINQKELYSVIEIALYRHEMDRKLRQSEARYKSLFDNSFDCVYLHDFEGNFLDANQAALHLLGFTREEIPSINLGTIVDEGYILKAFHVVQAMLKDGYYKGTIEYKLKRKDGEFVYIDTTGSLVYRDNKPFAIQGIARDITERKVAEKKLKESEERYKSLFENSLDCVFLYDFNGNFLDANKASLDLLGFKHEEITSVNFETLLDKSQSQNAYKFVEGILEDRKPTGLVEFKLKRKNGAFVFIETTSSLVFKDNKPVAIQGIARDITERKEAEELIKASLREKEILLQEIHHRVKNNMQVVSSLLSLQSKYIRDEKDRELFIDSQNRVSSMAMVHEKLYQSEDLSNIEFSGYIGELTQRLLTSYNISTEDIRLKIDAKDTYLDINSSIPCALILNELISNSLKHAFPDGMKGEIKVKFKKSRKGIYTLSVSDNGVGFPEGFDYKKTDSLGLRLINALPGQVKGEIKLVETKGAKFELTFPIEDS